MIRAFNHDLYLAFNLLSINKGRKINIEEKVFSYFQLSTHFLGILLYKQKNLNYSKRMVPLLLQHILWNKFTSESLTLISGSYMKIKFSEKETNIHGMTYGIWERKGLVVTRACYSVEKFPNNKKKLSRVLKEMEITDELVLQEQTWFLTGLWAKPENRWTETLV